jgi:tetratricopeptide (TPR) repeat protein
MRAYWLSFVVLSLAACATQPPAPPKPAPPPTTVAASSDLTRPDAARPDAASPDSEQERLLADAQLAIKSGMAQQAIERALDPIIATFEQRWGHSDRRVYSARTQAETTYYLAEALAHNEQAIALGPVWSEAYQLKAYALLDLGRMDEARSALDKALALSPQNAGYLEELGAHYEAEKNWPAAMRTFENAEAATALSPPQIFRDELARAWRGQAFVDVETGKLDEAEQLYLHCLELNKNDRRAAGELAYLRKKRTENDPANSGRVFP